MTGPSTLPDGAWKSLFAHALTLMNEVRQHGTDNPFWTFGGGTVLMLRYGHRLSKDIDIFVPNPQYLGFVNPRLSDAAAEITQDYEENAEFVRLVLPEGEIDFIVSSNLLDPGYEEWTLMGHAVKVETPAEIVAKKMWYRGDRPTARDLFDLSLVIERDPEGLAEAGRFLIRHRDAFLCLLDEHRDALRPRFDAIQTLNYTPTFEYCLGLSREFLAQFPAPVSERPRIK